MNMLRYKGYAGISAYDVEADLFHGRILGLRDVVTFAGRDSEELQAALADSVEDYLAFCRELGSEPECSDTLG